MSNINKFSSDNLKKDIEYLKNTFGNILKGDLSTLKTSTKTFVGAINEIYSAIQDKIAAILTGISISGDDVVTGTSATYTCSPTPSTADYSGVNWSVTGTEASINSSGVLTVSSSAWNDSVTIKATSKDNSSITDTKAVTVSYPMSATISGDSQINGSGQYTLTITPTKAASTPFTWSISSGSTYASISSSGEVTVNEGVENQTITIKATSEYCEATKTITVSNVQASETILFQTTSISNSSYDYPIMAQNTGLTEWTVLMSMNCASCGSAGIWVDDGISNYTSAGQNIKGGFSVNNYAWGAAKFVFNLGGNWIEGSDWNPGNNDSIKYAVTRSGDTVKYSTDGTSWETVSVSVWNTTGNPLTIGSADSGYSSIPSGGSISFTLYDTSEVSSGVLSEFFS